MTIEFRCPYCTAAIQVADSAAGTSGKCPKCAAKLTIPRPAALAPPKPPPSAAPTAAPVEPVGGVDLGEGAAAIVPVVDAAPAPLTAPIGRRRRRRKPIPPAVLIVFLLVIVAAVGGAAGWLYYQDWRSKQLVGELTAVELGYVELAPAMIDRTVIAVSEKEREELLRELQQNPLPMISELMQIQFRGSKAGLSIAIARGAKSNWYKVDTNSLPVLANYIQNQTEPLRTRRNEQVERAATEFLRQFQSVSQQKALDETILQYRDKLGVTALVRGVGLEAIAIVGQNMYPCVYEEADGTLYFLLPPRVKQFELTGRKNAAGRAIFPGRFTVTVKERKVDEGQAPPDLRKTPTDPSGATSQANPTEE